MAVLTITKENFDADVKSAAGPVLAEFMAPWCGYCRRLAPALDQLAEELEGKVAVGKVDIDEQSELAEAYEVETIPSLILFQGGKASELLVNPESKALIVEWLTEHGAL